jgi:hypothetical protein
MTGFAASLHEQDELPPSGHSFDVDAVFPYESVQVQVTVFSVFPSAVVKDEAMQTPSPSSAAPTVTSTFAPLEKEIVEAVLIFSSKLVILVFYQSIPGCASRMLHEDTF